MGARLLYATVFALLCLPLFLLRSDPATSQGLALNRALTEAAPAGEVLLLPGEGIGSFAEEHADALRSYLHSPEVEIQEDGASIHGLPLQAVPAPRSQYRVTLDSTAHALILLDEDGGKAARARIGTRLALLPPLLAILLAFLLRRTLLSLGLGVLLGAWMLVPSGASPFETLRITFVQILWRDILHDSFHLYILGFVFLLSASVAVITRMGGIEGMVRKLVRYARTARSVQFVAYFMGIAIFFDDYANTIVVGNSSGPLFDRLKVSRAKLAYIVDSTAAPMAGLAVLSTWVAFQISTYAPQLPTIGMNEKEGYALFLETIPYRFYCVFALLAVGIMIALRRDFGPMLKFERAARQGHSDALQPRPGSQLRIEMAPGTRPHWVDGFLPLLALIVVTAIRIYHYGAISIPADRAADLQAQGTLPWLREVLSESDSARAIFDGSLAALGLAALFALGRRQLSPPEVLRTTVRGLGTLFKDGIMVLILAWSIGEVCTGLDTAGYLVSVFADLLDPQWLPSILFVASCFVAFATGSSWTTMAILQPNVVLLAHRLGSTSELGSHGLLVLSIGAVLEGAIFGDHCSPISDTTILSSASSQCVHIDHVRTQAPYALLCAATALLIGYLPVSLLGFSPFLSMGLGLIALVLVFRFFGSDPETAGSATAAPQEEGQEPRPQPQGRQPSG